MKTLLAILTLSLATTSAFAGTDIVKKVKTLLHTGAGAHTITTKSNNLLITKYLGPVKGVTLDVSVNDDSLIVSCLTENDQLFDHLIQTDQSAINHLLSYSADDGSVNGEMSFMLHYREENQHGGSKLTLKMNLEIEKCKIHEKRND